MRPRLELAWIGKGNRSRLDPGVAGDEALRNIEEGIRVPLAQARPVVGRGVQRLAVTVAKSTRWPGRGPLPRPGRPPGEVDLPAVGRYFSPARVFRAVSWPGKGVGETAAAERACLAGTGGSRARGCAYRSIVITEIGIVITGIGPS